MKPNTQIQVTGGRRNIGWQGYTKEPHKNADNLIWCCISEKAPFPQPGEKRKDHHKELAFPASHLTAV